MLQRQGAVVEIIDNRKKKAPPANGGGCVSRGRITGFSRKSRNRLIDLFARLRAVGGYTKFITLTFNGQPSNREAYAVLRRFIERLRRREPKATGVWRKEYQERGAIHYHLLLFNVGYWKQSELQSVWDRDWETSV